MEIARNLRLLREEVEEKRAVACAGIVAVSKTFPFSDIERAYHGCSGERGQQDFGENRVHELEQKALLAREKGMDAIRWHFLGRIQTNKLKKLLALPNLEAIHSLGSLKQVELLKKFFSQQKNPVKIFLQVKTVLYEDKSGFVPGDDLGEAVAHMGEVAEKFPLQGLMTMGAIQGEDFLGKAEGCFRCLVSLREQMGEKKWELSMGMSRDYPLALSLGSRWIRVGEKIFGPRRDTVKKTYKL